MFQDLLNSIDDALNDFVIDMFTNLAASVDGTLRLMMILTIIIYGLAMMQGWIEQTLKGALKHLFMALVVYIFAVNVGLFTSILYELTTNAPSQLIGSVLSDSSNSTDGINGLVGDIFDIGMFTANDLIHETPWNAIGLKFSGVFAMFATVLLCGYAAYLIVLAKIAVGVLLGLAPIFIGLLMFGGTKGLFEGWLRQLLNYAIIPLLTYTILLFCIAMLQAPMDSLEAATASGDLNAGAVLPFIFSCIVGFLLLLQVMGITSAIAGGVSLSTLGSGAAAGRLAGKGFGKGYGKSKALGKAGLERIRRMRANKITN
ncbi:MAG: type IV secretion system protein [Flavobacteriales bacterium]|nr:type IV secretion system protein [Flavobacteriales bacterium]